MSLDEILSEGSPIMALAQRFVDAGHQLFLVGGPVRDAFIRSKDPSWPKAQDYDFATDASPSETSAILAPVASSVWKQGERFGTIGAEIEGITVEITTFRTEKYQPSSRHPDVEFASDIETDLLRRDFTVNAMAVELPSKRAVDLYGGLEDLANGLLRTPGDPRDSFGDDPLRMLRAFRFMSQLDFRIDPATFAAITELKEEIKTISAERIRDELSKLLIGRAPARALEWADKSGLLEFFLPEISALKLEQDPEHHHKDVFIHTLKVLERTEPVLEIRLAALLHDIGKPATRRISDKGVTFYHHEVVGARMARDRLKELRFSNGVVEEVTQLVALHQRFHGYSDDVWTDSAVRRYVRDAGPYLSHLNKLVRADCTTRNRAKAQRLAQKVDELDRRIDELRAKEELESIRPELDGNEVMKLLDIPPGPQVGEAMKFLLEIRLDEGEIGREAVIERLRAWAADQERA